MCRMTIVAIRLLVGTEKGLFALDADDRRESWTVSGPQHKGWQVYSLGRDDGDLFAGLSSRVYGPHLQRSRDLAESWVPLEGSPRLPEGSSRELKEIWSVASGPRPGTLWAGVAHAALFASQDGGDTWTFNEGLEAHPTRERWMPGAGGLCLHTIVQDRGNPDRTFIGISAVGIFRSDDGGASWLLKNQGVRAVFEEEEPKYTEIASCVHKFVQSPEDPNTLYQQNHTGVYRSPDAGDNWERIENGLPTGFGFPMVVLPGKPQTLFIVPQESDQFRMYPDGRPGVYRTRNGGDSWERTHVGLAEPAYSGVLRNSMTTDAHDEPGLYFGTTGGEVHASFDEGDSWRPLPGRYPRIQSLAAITR